MLSVNEKLNIYRFQNFVESYPIDTEDTETDILDKLEKFKKVVENTKGTRRSIEKTLDIDLEKEFPLLYQKFLQYQNGIRLSILGILDVLNCDLQSVIPKDKEMRPKQNRFLQKLGEYFENKSLDRRTGFVKYPSGMGKTVLMAMMIRSLSSHDDVKSLVLSPRNVINQQNEKNNQRVAR